MTNECALPRCKMQVSLKAACTHTLQVELSLEEELRHLRSPAHKGSLHAGAREDVIVTGTKPAPGQIVNGGAA
ncbi:MAG: hypothetical protein ACPIOQ_70620 [Promethearchaeia archaeon]